MRFDAIIFDCDGTLVDSETLGNAVIVDCAQELGLDLTLEVAIKNFAGRKMADTIDLIAQWLGKPVPDWFLPIIRERMAIAFEERLTAIDGVHELLQKLSVPVCVASNGPQDKMKISLRVTGLLPYFHGRIYSAYDCESWKPEPGLFLYAARVMGVNPSNCAVVEDSPLGIQAALAAGMTPFGYSPDGDDARLAIGDTRIFANMSSLQDLLQ
jgi:HAD superfamily hydrolase (TIGR01509 family)